MALTSWRPHLGVDDGKLVVRIVVAAAISWWLAERLGGPLPVFAAIVPLFALRADDPYGVIDVSLWRILGTFVGVLLGLLVRRPSDPYNAVVAVTAALVLVWGGSQAGVLAQARLWETALGGVVTIVVGIFLWPTDPVARLIWMLRDQAERVPATLDTIGSLLGASAEDADHALEALLRSGEHDPDVMAVLAKADRGLRLNPLRRGQRTALPELAVRARTLGAMQRYARSTVWDLATRSTQQGVVAGGGAECPALEDALAGLQDAARAVGQGDSTDAAAARVTRALDAVASAEHVATHELRNDLRIVLRVLGPYAQMVLQSSSTERYAR